MKSKIEKQMRKEARQIECPFVLNDVQDKLGIEPTSTKVKFWTKPKILTLSSVTAMAAVAAIVIPTALNATSSVKYTLATITLNSSLVDSSTTSLKSKKSQSSNTSSSNTSDITISLYLKNDAVVKASASSSNAQILLSGITDANPNVQTYLNVLTNAAISAGFLDKLNSDNYISLLAYSEDSSYETAVLNKMGSGIINSLKSNYVYAYLINESSVNNNDEFALAKQYNIDIPKYKLIEKVIELYPNAYTFDILSQYTLEQLSDLLEAKMKDVKYDSIESTEFKAKREELIEAIKEHIPTLEQYQEQIDELKEYIKANNLEIGYEFMSFDYRRYMMENEKIPFSIIYSEEIKSSHSSQDSMADEVEELIELVEETKEYINKNIKPLFKSFEESEKQAIQESEEEFKSNYNRMCEENSNDDRDDEWKELYSKHYSSDSEYWIIK
jgi:hypothetical protein